MYDFAIRFNANTRHLLPGHGKAGLPGLFQRCQVADIRPALFKFSADCSQGGGHGRGRWQLMGIHGGLYFYCLASAVPKELSASS